MKKRNGAARPVRDDAPVATSEAARSQDVTQPIAFWIAGVFGESEARLYGNPSRAGLEWWRDGLRTYGMTGLKGITKILGPWTEEQARSFVEERGGGVLSASMVEF